LLAHQASVEAGSEFIERRAPGMRAVADPDGMLFDAFGMRRGNLWEVLGPTVWWPGLRALLRGHFPGRPTADTLRMPGALVVRGREILWRHRPRHAADHPDFGAASAVLLARR
jgi:hypothetical protein